MINYSRRVLDNGLTILVHQDNSTPLAAVNVIYKVGARDEEPQRTGFAHLFEHLMFSGTAEVPEFDIPIQMSSGENNAFTNNDYTNYYIVLPKDNLDVALHLEADRMVNLNINEHSLSIQQSVVEEEYNERYKNKPYGDLWQIIREMVYKEHPYRWSTIGKDIAHVRDASLDDVRSFYKRYYTPHNAIIAVAGDLEPEATLDLIESVFKDINKGEPVVKNIPQEPKQLEQRRMTVTRDVPSDMVYILFRMGERISREFAICDVISDMLSGGSSSRMYQSLVKEQRLFNTINAYIMGSLDEGMFVVMGQPVDGVSPQDAEEALWGSLEDIKSGEISDYELDKVKNKFEVNTIFGEINVMNKAMNLCFYEMLGDIEIINKECETFASITKDEIYNTSKKLFTKENSSVLHYLKEGDK